MSTHALIQWISDNEIDVIIDKILITNGFSKQDLKDGLKEDTVYSVRHTDRKKYKARLLLLGKTIY
jgi:hypothetical protein